MKWHLFSTAITTIIAIATLVPVDAHPVASEHPSMNQSYATLTQTTTDPDTGECQEYSK